MSAGVLERTARPVLVYFAMLVKRRLSGKRTIGGFSPVEVLVRKR